MAVGAAANAGNRGHARAGILETLIFRMASRNTHALAALVSGYASKKMGEWRARNHLSEGIRPLVAACAGRFGESDERGERWRYTQRHSLEVAYFSFVMACEAQAQRVPEASGLQPELLFAGGFVHDVGKTFLPPALLVKELGIEIGPFVFLEGSKPTKDELRLMRLCHLRDGTDFVRFFGPGQHIRCVLDMVGLHHVSENGMDSTHPSYPTLMKGCELPLSARFAKAADFMSAVMPRHYREEPFVLSFEDALAYAVAVSGRELSRIAVRCLLTGFHAIGAEEADALISRLASPGTQEDISDVRKIRRYVHEAVLADPEFADLMARKDKEKIRRYGKAASACARDFGAPAIEGAMGNGF